MGSFLCCDAFQNRFPLSPLPDPGHRPRHLLPSFPDPYILATPPQLVCPLSVSRCSVYLSSPLPYLHVRWRGVPFGSYHRCGSAPDREFGRMGPPGGEDARRLNSAKRISSARATAEENSCTGKEKGYREDGGMNVADKVRYHVP